MGDRIGILNKGVLEQLDTPEVCYSTPNSRFVARFMGEASFLKAQFDNSENNVDNTVITDVGNVPGTPLQNAHGDVDLLVRPDDLSLDASHASPNGTVDWVRYEGESRLYAVMLDNGSQLKVRVSHENAIKPGERAHIQLITTHPLAVFPREA